MLLSVTEVRNALRCPRVFALGRREGRAVSFPVGASSLGATFHRIVDRLARSAESPPPSLAVLPTGSDRAAVETELRSWFIDQLVAEIEQCPALATMPAEVDDLAEALRAFAAYVARRIAGGPDSPAAVLARFFDVSELDVEAPLGGEPLVQLRGRIDAVHLAPGDRYEVVEYKLTSSDNAVADAAQVALYRLLLKLARRIDADAVVLRFDPELSVSRIERAQADALVERQLLPLVRNMVGWASVPEKAPPPARADLCASCPMRAPCVQTYAEYFPSRDDPPAGAPRPRPTASGDVEPAGARELPIAPEPEADPSGEADARAFEQALAQVLRDLGVGVRICPPTLIGPRLIRVEVAALRGRVSRIDNAAEDVRHRLHQKGLRVSYERRGGQRLFFAPRSRSRPVMLPPLLAAQADWLSERAGRFVLGEGVDGTVVTGDLSEPVSSHLLVAGATGSGKSVLLRALVTSLAHFHDPGSIRFTLVDPKRVSFAPLRSAIGAHLDGPLCYEAEAAVQILEDLVAEMERRYRQFEERRVEDIAEHNEYGAYDQMVRHVVVIDEFQDLMTVPATRKPFEAAVQRLGSKARAAGIHLVLATQHPTAQVIPTSIKANLTGRVALRVHDWRASKVILDASGAEELLGEGDLLAGVGLGLVRAQAPLV